MVKAIPAMEIGGVEQSRLHQRKQCWGLRGERERENVTKIVMEGCIASIYSVGQSKKIVSSNKFFQWRKLEK